MQWIRPLLKEGAGSNSSFAFKGTHKNCVFTHTQIGAHLTSYDKKPGWYFERKRHIHILRTRDLY